MMTDTNVLNITLEKMNGEKKTVLFNKQHNAIDLLEVAAKAFQLDPESINVFVGDKACADRRCGLAPIANLLPPYVQNDLQVTVMVCNVPRTGRFLPLPPGLPEPPTCEEDSITIVVGSMMGRSKSLTVHKDITCVEFVRVVAHEFYCAFGMANVVFKGGKSCLHPIYALEPLRTLATVVNEETGERLRAYLIHRLGGPDTALSITIRYLALPDECKARWDLRAIGERLLNTERIDKLTSTCPICFADKVCVIMNCEGLHHMCQDCIKARFESLGRFECCFCRGSFTDIL